MSSHNNNATRNVPVGGVLLPFHWLNLLKDVSSLAEFKVICAVYGYDGIVGVEAEPLTFTDLVQRTGLSKPSVSTGIDAALERGEIVAIEDGSHRCFCPGNGGKENSLPHVHDHESLNSVESLNSKTLNYHEHDEKSLRQKLYQTLLNDFGFTKSPRVAGDICLTPKYPTETLQAQIRYTRWEITHGADGNPKRPVRNPAGRLVYRIKNNEMYPKGFVLLDALLDEGLTRREVYEAVYTGEVDLPEIEDSYDYVSWRAGTGVWFDRVLPEGEDDE